MKSKKQKAWKMNIQFDKIHKHIIQILILKQKVVKSTLTHPKQFWKNKQTIDFHLSIWAKRRRIVSKKVKLRLNSLATSTTRGHRSDRRLKPPANALPDGGIPELTQINFPANHGNGIGASVFGIQLFIGSENQ